MTEKQQAECTIEADGTGVFVVFEAFGSPSPRRRSPRTMGPDFRMAGQQSTAISFLAISFPAHRSRVCSFVPDSGRAPAAFHTYSVPRMVSGANEDGGEPSGIRLVGADADAPESAG